MATARAMPACIETDRLHLRPWTPADAVPLRAMWSERDARARRRIDAHGRPTVDDLRREIESRVATTARTGFALLAIERREVPGFIGYCGLTAGQATEAEPEIAYELLRRFHGHGYATEAARAVLVAADRAGRHRLWSTVRDWNVPSRRVMAEIGFVESGRVDHDSHRGDSIWYVRDAPGSGAISR